ncbi:MAG: response regulator [Chloroflexota bacterium]
MAYKVFLVEDEIVTREGIRERVDWQGNGFAFCGEASDGEMALPLIQASRPDVLITDIKMPFMDGLQLSKIVRERIPGVKIVILSGHDEFEYAQQAIQIGITEYLLKPVTTHDIHRVLRKLTQQLDQERKEEETRRKLQAQVAESQALLQEKLLMKLMVGAVSLPEALEEGQAIGLDLVARSYFVMLIKTVLNDRSDPFDYEEYKQVLAEVSSLAANDPDVFLVQKDWEELVLVIKGNAPEFLAEERERLAKKMQEVTGKTRYQLKIGVGTPKNRLTDIRQSFAEALVNVQPYPGATNERTNPARAELLEVDRAAVENYLRCGTLADFDAFFESYLHPLRESALQASIKHYILVDFILSAAQLIGELDGEIDSILAQLHALETTSMQINSTEQLKAQLFRIASQTLAYRDEESKNSYNHLIRQAKAYLAGHYTNPELSLNDVAAHVNLSPSHFSTVFSQETGQTFKEYLIGLRIQKAKELLRTTRHKTAEISYEVGYHDAHYFSAVFRKNTGMTPTEFRAQAYRSQL